MAEVFGEDYHVEYVLECYRGPSFTFTESGHVDMDAFDQSGSDTDYKTLVVFYDQELEEASQHLIEELEAKYKKEHKDAPWILNCDEVNVKRRVVRKEKKERVTIQWFWDEVLCLENGFDPSDFSWSETDKHGQPFKWEYPDGKRDRNYSEDALKKQVPKLKDFLAVVIEHFEAKLHLDYYDGYSYEDIVEEFKEEVENVMGLLKEHYFSDEFWWDDIP